MKNIFTRIVGSLPKKLAASALIVLAITLPASSVFAGAPVAIQATTGVANVTAGDTTYNSSVNASYDQVVKTEVTYYNPATVDSGQVAQGLHVKINIPSTPGSTQTITTVTGGTNTNTVNGQAVVNLAQSNGYLQFIPGSAQARITNPDGTISNVVVPDSEINSAQGYAINNGNPCQAAAVAVEARVMVPGVSITKKVEGVNQSNAWTTTMTANPGDTVKYMITYTNTGNTVENQVVIRDNLPPKMVLVPNSTYLYNVANPNGFLFPNNDITQGGEVIGNYGAGANAYVVFKVTIPTADKLACGNTQFTNVGVVRPQNMNEFENSAIVNVNKVCTTPPVQPPVTPPTTPSTPTSPTQLVNTGPGSIAGIFAGTVIAGAIGHRLFKNRQLARSSR